jgi:hypothetical protein
VSCNNSSEKVKNAEAAVTKADSNLVNANQEYLTEIENYKKETAEKIATNDKSIVEFKARVAQEKKSARADYLAKVEALEKKNSDLKKRMDDYKADSKEKWDMFKTEFNHDMEEIGKSFKDLTVKNVKTSSK